MFSVLVPIYNFDVREFVRELDIQLKIADVPYEILCYDDASGDEFRKINRELEIFEHVVYKELPENVGRSVIRNRLADNSRYDYLLFVDCDSKIERKDYIQKYLKELNPELVVYGGRSYEEFPPEDKKKYLRWLYGMKREVVSPEIRNMKPYKSFMTNNVVIPRQVFQSVRFNEELKGYGHEDTLFGKELKERNVKIKHINNPLCHIGLEDAKTFLAKTNEGVENLVWLIKQGKIDQDTKLFRYYQAVKKAYMARPLRKSFKKRKEVIIKNLLSENPNLRTFDFYKLGYLLEVIETEK